MKLRQRMKPLLRRADSEEVTQWRSPRLESLHHRKQSSGCRRAAAERLKKLSQSFDFGAIDLPSNRSPPGCRQIECECEFGTDFGDGVSYPSHLIAGSRRDYCVFGVCLRQFRHRVGEGTDTFRDRDRGVSCNRPHAARFKAVRLDPFHRHPGTAVKDLHKRDYGFFCATIRPWMVLPRSASVWRKRISPMSVAARA